jgi:hypothetical protein
MRFISDHPCWSRRSGRSTCWFPSSLPRSGSSSSPLRRSFATAGRRADSCRLVKVLCFRPRKRRSPAGGSLPTAPLAAAPHTCGKPPPSRAKRRILARSLDLPLPRPTSPTPRPLALHCPGCWRRSKRARHGATGRQTAPSPASRVGARRCDARAAMALIRETGADCAPPGLSGARRLFNPGVHCSGRGPGPRHRVSRYACI